MGGRGLHAPALEILARASARVIAEGEVLQLTRAHDLDLSQEVYLEIIRAKTAELFAAAAASPARFPRARRGIRCSGAAAAMAARTWAWPFQLVDDVLDYSGDSDTLGKNSRRRFPRRQGDASPAAGHGPQRTSPQEREFWIRTVDRREQTDADFQAHLRTDARHGAPCSPPWSLAASYARSAKAALADFGANPWRPALEDLADFAVARTA